MRGDNLDLRDRFVFNISRPVLNKGTENMEKTIEIGEYRLPEGCVARIVGGVLTVRKRKSPFPDETVDRCRDCEFFGLGKTFKNAWYQSHVCHKKPKGDKEDMFYAANPHGKSCELFKRRTSHDVR